LGFSHFSLDVKLGKFNQPMELIAVIDGDSPWKTEQQACHKVVNKVGTPSGKAVLED